ncbi:hypothetical protein Tco_0378310 [Tanacetum coccineum]
MVKIPRCMSWLGSTDAYDEPIGSLGMMDNEVGNTSPQITPQIIPSFEEYTPPVTYTKEVEETLGTPMEVEPLDQTKLEDVSLTNHNISLSSREVLIFDEPEPQPQPLPSYPSLDVSLGDERGPEPPIKSHSPDSFWMKVVDSLTIHTPPPPHVASFHPKNISCYYHPCVDDPKKHYGLKPAFGRHLEEIHMTWTQFGKKRDKIATLHEDDQDMAHSRKAHLLEDNQIPSVRELMSIWEAFERKNVETASGFALTSSRVKSDGVTTTCDAVTMTDKEKPYEDSAS